MLRLSARLQMVAMHSERHSRYREGIICTSGITSATEIPFSTCHKMQLSIIHQEDSPHLKASQP